MYDYSKGHVWLQLYNFQDEEFVMELLDRAEKTGYKVAILTVGSLQYLHSVYAIRNKIRD